MNYARPCFEKLKFVWHHKLWRNSCKNLIKKGGVTYSTCVPKMNVKAFSRCNRLKFRKPASEHIHRRPDILLKSRFWTLKRCSKTWRENLKKKTYLMKTSYLMRKRLFHVEELKNFNEFWRILKNLTNFEDFMYFSILNLEEFWRTWQILKILCIFLF